MGGAVTDVLLPSSPEEAVSAYGDGAGVTVVAGGTIVMAEIGAGRLKPSRTLLLARAGLAGVSREGGKVTIGATAPLEALVDLPAPVGPCAANVGDIEIRTQATVGGNLCAGEGLGAPRGDLQGALLAVGAQVRSAGAGGETTGPLDDFLANRRDRLVLDVSYDEPSAGAFVGARPAAHARVHGPRRLGRTVRRRHRPARGHRRRFVGRPAPVRGGGGKRPPGRRSRGAPRRDPARRRARVGVVPLAGPARARPPGARPAPGERMSAGLTELTNERTRRPLPVREQV